MLRRKGLGLKSLTVVLQSVQLPAALKHRSHEYEWCLTPGRKAVMSNTTATLADFSRQIPEPDLTTQRPAQVIQSVCTWHHISLLHFPTFVTDSLQIVGEYQTQSPVCFYWNSRALFGTALIVSHDRQFIFLNPGHKHNRGKKRGRWITNVHSWTTHCVPVVQELSPYSIHALQIQLFETWPLRSLKYSTLRFQAQSHVQLSYILHY